MSFFCIFGKHLLSLVMLACRIPRGSIFVVATRDYLLLALTNQPSAALWESRTHLQIQGGLLKYSRCYSRLFSYVGASPACAPCCCVLLFWADTSVCPYGRIANLMCRVFLLLLLGLTCKSWCCILISYINILKLPFLRFLNCKTGTK